MLGLNTRRGNVTLGENGLAALPGRQAEARAAIEEALAYASDVLSVCSSRYGRIFRRPTRSSRFLRKSPTPVMQRRTA